MANVSLDSGGNITGVYAQPQAFSVVIPDDDPRLAAFNPSAPPTQVSFLQFVDLFTPAEQQAIVTSTDTQVKLFVMRATGAVNLDLSNPEVVGGVRYLASLGIITADRETSILAGVPPA